MSNLFIDSRQIKSNYRPVFLLPICGKILEIFFSMTFIHILTQIILFLKINLVSDRGTPLSTSFFVLQQIYLFRLKTLVGLGTYFVIFHKRFISFISLT